MAKQPKIRFKGFTEEWKEKKISDLLLERIDMAPQNDAYPLMAFVANKGIVSKGDRYDRSALIKDTVNKPYKRTSYGDFIYSSNNLEAGSIGMNFYGNASISPVYSIFAPKGDNNPYYLGVRLAMPDIIHEMVRCRQGVVYGQWKIHEDEFLNISVKMPKPDEQKAISQVIIDLTTTISQREKELEKLKNIKRALLGKLFPQDGQSIPALRFKGFEGKWEPKSLGEVADKVTTKNLSCSINETFTNSAEYGIMSQRDFFDHSISNSNNISGYYVVQQDDFVYNPRISKNAPVGPINRNKLGRSGVVSPLYTVFRPNGKLDLDYLEVFFWQYSWNKFMKFNGNSGARLDRFSISDEVFWQMPIQSPKTPEQKKVANTLLLLSKTISLRERQLTLLKHSKQALLEQMFVNN